MQEDVNSSFSAPSARATAEELAKGVLSLSESSVKGPFLNVSPALLLVLNGQRQIVHANESMLSFLDIGKDMAGILGKRPGEALHCENCKLTPNGCGSGEACRQCGALIAIMNSLESGKTSIGECHLAREIDGHVEALDLRISCVPVFIDGAKYVIFNALDISDELRRNYLEGVFIHEIRNSAGNVLTLVGLLKDECDQTQAVETASMLQQATSRLMAEIDGHRMLIDAETGNLKQEPVSFSSVQLLERLASEYSKGPYGEDKKVEVFDDSVELALNADPSIVSHAIGNLIRNALEASKPGGLVKIGCDVAANWNYAIFKVWNATEIDRDVQLQIFHRYFSTKSSSKGIGTYMSRLLVERYLGGNISFESSKEGGTVFMVRLPLKDSFESAKEQGNA